MTKEVREIEVKIDEDTFNSILLGNKTCIHSFSDEKATVGTQIELIEMISKKKTGRKIFVEITYIDHIKEPFNIYLFSIEVVGASNI